MGLVLLPCIPQISFFKKTQGFDMWQIYGQSKIITIKAKPCAGTARAASLGFEGEMGSWGKLMMKKDLLNPNSLIKCTERTREALHIWIQSAPL